MNSFSNSALQQSLQITKDYLNDFINSSNAGSNLAIAFGDSLDRQQGLNVIESLVANNLDSLNIEILPSQEINYGQGAYVAGSNTIYLAEQFVTENLDNPNAIANIIIEEIGHYVDWRANIEDAPGDEGAIFASLVAQEDLSTEELAVLKTEDDSAEVNIDGETVTIEQAQTIFVNQAATGENDGTSWANAYTDLQSAIANAEANDEVWVAAGTYLPTTESDREISFNLTEFVQFYGGFAGTETERNQRDVEANETILSGNIGTTDDRTDNSYHVVDITSTAATTVLDGFTITDGYADGDFSGTAESNPVVREESVGGGIYSDESGNAQLSNLTIVDNFALGTGGGLYLDASSNPVLTNVDLVNNEAQRFGGGLRTRDSSPTLNSVTISSNLAGQDGGGVSNSEGEPVFNWVVFSDNVANNVGGAIANFDNDSVEINNSLFEGNQSQSGGAIYNQDSNLAINNVTFYGNQSDFGGVVYNFEDRNTSGSIPTNSIISNSILVNNSGALDELQIVNDQSSEIVPSNTTVNNSIVEGGYEGGANILDVNPRFINPEEGDFRIRSNSPAIDVGDGSVIDAEFDLAGSDRVINGSVDLGAYEFQDNLPEGTVYRLFNPEVGVHFYTSSKEERNNTIENLPQYEYEGAAFGTVTEEEADSVTGAQPVYRFFNTDTGVHLYTIDEAERDSIQENLPNFLFEGISYYAYETEQEGTIPLYRFYNPEVGAHFYTPFAVERDNVIETLPEYQLEGDGGIAFYVEPLLE